MKKAMELLDAVKESIINAYVRKTGQSRAKLSHLMDAETWMDANKAVELGFADDILFQKEEQGSEGENGDSGAGRTENGTSDSVMFSRRAVNNALMNKLERHYGKTGKSVKDQAGIAAPKLNSVYTGRSADDLRERLNLSKNAELIIYKYKAEKEEDVKNIFIQSCIRHRDSRKEDIELVKRRIYVVSFEHNNTYFLGLEKKE